MVPSRRRLPIPAWAELPTDSAASDAFRPFVTTAFVMRVVAPTAGAAIGTVPDVQPILRDDDSDAPKASPF